jgi:hypothetical protein
VKADLMDLKDLKMAVSKDNSKAVVKVESLEMKDLMMGVQLVDVKVLKKADEKAHSTVVLWVV